MATSVLDLQSIHVIEAWPTNSTPNLAAGATMNRYFDYFNDAGGKQSDRPTLIVMAKPVTGSPDPFCRVHLIHKYLNMEAGNTAAIRRAASQWSDQQNKRTKDIAGAASEKTTSALANAASPNLSFSADPGFAVGSLVVVNPYSESSLSFVFANVVQGTTTLELEEVVGSAFPSATKVQQVYGVAIPLDPPSANLCRVLIENLDGSSGLHVCAAVGNVAGSTTGGV